MSATHQHEATTSRAWSLLVLAGIGVLASSLLGAQASSPTESRSKANFLTNFPDFVEWPATTFASPQAPITICVRGDLRFGALLAEAARGVLSHGRPVEIRWARKKEELRVCQIVFVSRSESKRYSELFQNIEREGVLTVGETPDFLAAGGMVSFDFARDALQFEVNLPAADNAHVRISSRLLALARRVLRTKEQDRPSTRSSVFVPSALPCLYTFMFFSPER